VTLPISDSISIAISINQIIETMTGELLAMLLAALA
jgi:hypothetical protein